MITEPVVSIPPSKPAPRADAAGPGKSAQSPGQMAKAAVAAARAEGIELPKNAQGMAASQIAQGADPASVFAAIVQPEPALDAEEGVAPADGSGESADVPVSAGPEGSPAPLPDTGSDPEPTVAPTVAPPVAPSSDAAVPPDAGQVAAQASADYAASGQILSFTEATNVTSARIALDLLS